jgi:hypothetical protein
MKKLLMVCITLCSGILVVSGLQATRCETKRCETKYAPKAKACAPKAKACAPCEPKPCHKTCKEKGVHTTSEEAKPDCYRKACPQAVKTVTHTKRCPSKAPNGAPVREVRNDAGELTGCKYDIMSEGCLDVITDTNCHTSYVCPVDCVSTK